MPSVQAETILRAIRRIRAQHAPRSDGDLLQCFLERRDEMAFAVLVGRHGPMVLGVCQAVLHNRHDAEDAFQTTFLALARKAASIRRWANVGGWLHGVAYRVARKSQAAAARHRVLETKAAVHGHTAPADDLSWSEVRTLLHHEIDALPERLRAPLVLCYLEGLTQDEAAQALGWPVTTVKGRLQRGRERLRRRLQSRGLHGAAALGVTALADQTLTASVPTALTEATLLTVKSASLKVGQTALVALLRGLVGPLAQAKSRMLAVGLLLASVVTGGVLSLPGTTLDPAFPAAAKPADIPAPAARVNAHGDPLPDGAVARLGSTRFNHGQGLREIFFPPDGKTIISEGNGLIRVWDPASGKELRHFSTAKPSRSDDAIALAPDGRTLTFLNQENPWDALRAWDLAEGKEVRMVQLPVQRGMWSIDLVNVVSTDGHLGALHTPRYVHVFNLVTAKELYKLDAKDGQIQAVVFAGADRLVTADKNQNIMVWEARSGKLLRQFAHGAPVKKLFASSDGRQLATLEHHNHGVDRLLEKDPVRLWDVATGTLLHTLTSRPQRWLTMVKFSPDSKRLYTNSAGPGVLEMTIWDVETGQRLSEFPNVYGSAFNLDGTLLAVGTRGGKFDLLDPKTGSFAQDRNPFARPIGIALSSAGDRAITTAFSEITSWDASTGRRLRSFDVPVFGLFPPFPCRLPYGRFALTFEGDWTHIQIHIWDVPQGKHLYTLRPPDAHPQVSCGFSSDGSLLAIFIPGNRPERKSYVRIYDVASGRQIHAFPEEKGGWFRRLFFSADHRELFMGGKKLLCCDIATGKELFSWGTRPVKLNSGLGIVEAAGGKEVTEDDRDPWSEITMSPDRTLVACFLSSWMGKGASDPIALYDARTGNLLRRWGGNSKAGHWYGHLEFSPDGRLLASADGNSVHVWEVATGKLVRTLQGHRGEVDALAFSGNGRRLASGSMDSTCLIWDVPLAVGASVPGATTERDLAAWWQDLASPDARRAYAAVWRLAAVPGVSVPFLGRRLQPVTDAQVKEIRQYLTDLENSSFTARRNAFERLQHLGLAAAPALREAAAQNLSLEARRRVEQLLDALRDQPPSGEPLRTLRALAVLESAGTAEAQRFVRDLAAGAPGAWLTGEARAMDTRMSQAEKSAARHP
jgi:RNA polymerase sigma factor (sigma-70 family)